MPAHDRVASLPKESTIVNQSNDNGDSDSGGFVFHQIGDVETWCDESDDLQTLNDTGKGDWMKTGFAAVMRLAPSGTPNGVYIIFDFHPENSTADRSPRYDLNHWGFLGKEGRQFSCARIANKISDLDLFYQFQIPEIVEHPVEIVRVVKSAQGSMARVTVAE